MRHLPYPRFEVVELRRLAQAYREGAQVPAGHAAVGVVAFVHDVEGHRRRMSSSSRKHSRPPMFTRPSFLLDIVQPSAYENISSAISRMPLSA